ncbi:hypothetical protein [Herbiconiux liukaitaii]|uniref:hypothetical protein n=1 Tax=Herbiconiux liukaitaii TaxID=3342799 RepID=UPI0035BAC90E
MFDWVGVWTAQEWQAIWGCATFIVAVLAAALALVQLRAHYAQQREQSRPFVTVDFAFRSTAILMIEIKNIGATPAADIYFEWDQLPRGSDELAQDPIQRQLIDGPMPFLAPGRVINFFVATMSEMEQQGAPPRRLTAIARYRDSAGRSYADKNVLDLDQWALALADDDFEQDSYNELKRQTAALEKIAKAVPEVGSKLDNLNVWFASQSEVKAATNRDDEYRFWRRRRVDQLLRRNPDHRG